MRLQKPILQFFYAIVNITITTIYLILLEVLAPWSFPFIKEEIRMVSMLNFPIWQYKFMFYENQG
jgi:hypothetical protein